MKRKPLSLSDWILAVLFGATIVVVAAQVLWRYAFNNSLVWTEELSRYLFVWMTFVGAAVAVGQGTHVRVGLLADRLPPRWGRRLAAAQYLLVAVFLAFLTVVGFRWVKINSGVHTPALRLPLNWVLYGALPVTTFFGTWLAVRRAWKELRAEPAASQQVEEG